MPRTRVLSAFLITLVGALVVAQPSRATTVDSLSYFAMGPANTCVASDPQNPGSFYRTYQEPSNQCPGLTVFHQVKGGGPQGPYGTESFYLKDGYIWQMMEISYANGAITDYRAFRNQANFWKGIKWIPASYSSSGVSFNPSPFKIEHWTNNSGQSVCLNTIQTSQLVNNQTSSANVVALPAWIQDKRSGSATPNTWRDVDAIVRADIWGANGENLEEYYYGRWVNPATGGWEPLGLVAWNWYVKNGSGQFVLSDHLYFHYLVDCSLSVPCSTCPP
jgi:hypothetical protein